MPSSEAAIRLLSESDLPAVLRLKEQAGWNQTAQDWLRLLQLEPQGCFAAWLDGRIVATTTTTCFGAELAWVGMVLVDPAYRRRGLATQLMRAALAYLQTRGVAGVKLDATPLGQPVYEALNFVVEGDLERLATTAQSRATTECQTLNEAMLPQVFALDREAFGANRRELLKALLATVCAPPLAVVAADGSLRGYALARRGAVYDYLGPLVARDQQTALLLLDAMLAQLAGQQIFFDFHPGCGISAAKLATRGFVKQRNLTRMRLGERGAGTSPLVIGLAGPEVG